MDAEAPPQPPPLTTEEARILGCLIEKEITLPDYYPLTLNALVTACNQTTNREPVMMLSEGTVIEALENLKARNYVFQVTMAGARVQKYKHNIKGKFPRLEVPGIALLCVLLLRGAQTVGELRQRCERLYHFPTLESVEAELTNLINHSDGPLVACLPAGAGRRVAAFVQLLSAPETAASSETAAPAVIVVPKPVEVADQAWRERMEIEIELLKSQVARLKTRLGIVD